MPRKHAAAADGKAGRHGGGSAKAGGRAASAAAAGADVGGGAAASCAAAAPVGLLAEAEAVGACLAAGHGAHLLAGLAARPAGARGAPAPAEAAARPEPPARAAGAAARGGALVPALGCEVRLSGLVAAPELNGRTGVLQEFHQERGRWAVGMPEGGPPKLVRPQNLEVLRPAPAPPEPPPGLALKEFKMAVRPMEPCGAEVLGFDARRRPPRPAVLELERVMAKSGFVLFRGQGALTGVEQCALSEMFGTGQLHSTHGVHRRAPNQHILRLSNDPSEGFNEVGPEWHHCGASVQNVFGHVVYHSVAAPRCGGETLLAHTGDAWDALPQDVQQEWEKLVSVNSNGGMVHPLVFTHPRSGRSSLFLHLGMTGAMLRCDGREGAKAWKGIDAMDEASIGAIFKAHSENLERIAYKHRWRAGDVLVLDNLAVAHKAAASAFQLSGGLRILHRSTVSGDWPLLAQPDLGVPTILDTAGPSPFGSREHVWEAGYTGMRWGSWTKQRFPF